MKSSCWPWLQDFHSGCRASGSREQRLSEWVWKWQTTLAWGITTCRRLGTSALFKFHSHLRFPLHFKKPQLDELMQIRNRCRKCVYLSRLGPPRFFLMQTEVRCLPLSEPSWPSLLAVHINIFSRDSTQSLDIKRRRGDTWEWPQLHHFVSAPWLVCPPQLKTVS